MLELSLLTTPDGPPAVSVRTPGLRMSGGALSTENDLCQIITYSQGRWNYRGHCYPLLAVTGGACLVFGIAREPTVVSDPIDHFYFTGPILSTNGVPIAKYREHQNTWQGILRPMWWVYMRIVGLDILSGVVGRRPMLRCEE